ncbi:hypothetical protein [Streptomyces sp. NPDC014623]|uniref:hypothetical protein n=1 Tax=Streptomyces sp. NPDC014623 TaxID=3364875 RepID=UPI00370352CA
MADFASATPSHDDPLTMDPAYDGGDGLHPDDAGTRVMADAVDLGMLLARPAPEGSPRTWAQRR